MLPIGECTLNPIPPLRAGVLSLGQVERIEPGFINWNPATGSYIGLPSRFGWQRWRLRTGRYHAETTRKIFDSLDQHGQKNPVLLWARFGYLLAVHGGTRIFWALQRNQSLSALIVDYDHRFDDWRLVPYESILNEYTVPPHGVVPMQFGWAYGEDYVVADAREWQMMSQSEWDKHIESQPTPKRKRGRPKKVEVVDS